MSSYCKTGNFRVHFNFAKFASFVNSRKWSARESKKSMCTSINHGKQQILSAGEMFKTKNCELLVQRIFHVIQYIFIKLCVNISYSQPFDFHWWYYQLMHGFFIFQPAPISSALRADVAATETDSIRSAAMSAAATTSTNIYTAEVSASHSQGLTSTVL